MQHPVRRFLSVGRLVEKKGHDTTIRAFAEILRRFPDAGLDIIGDGPLESMLKRLILEVGANDRIRLLGALANSEVMERMRGSDAVILCSQTASDGDEEGTPTVLVEAQQNGKPCISTRHAGIPEMFPACSQWMLAPERDVAAIAERIGSLMTLGREPLEAICRDGYDYAKRHFDLTTETQKLLAIYARCAAARETRGTSE